MKVFDISFWQPYNTVYRLKDLGAEGVILRMGVTYGGVPELDEKYINFVNEVKNVGIPHGLYYYSKINGQYRAREEAQFINDRVYDILGGVEPPLGVWFDIEDNVNRYWGIHDDVCYAIDTMRNWGFKKVGIYSGYFFFHDYFKLRDLEERQVPIWCAQYDYHNDLKEEYPGLNWHGWQFTDNYNNQYDCSEWYKEILI